MYATSGKPAYRENASATAMVHHPSGLRAAAAWAAYSIPSNKRGRKAIGFVGAWENQENVPFKAKAMPPAVAANRPISIWRSRKYVLRPATNSTSAWE